jgi:hypothetical protein
MQLDDYIRVLVKRWYISVALMAIAVSGAWMYNRITATHTAESTVAVPVSSLVSWDATFNGQELSERIAASLGDGRTAEEIRGKYAGEYRFTTGRLTPQFVVRADDDVGEKATLLANTAVEQALILFEENRRARTDYVLAAYRDQMDQAEAGAVEARRALDNFLVDNNAYSLPSRLAEQASLVTDLRQQATLAGIVQGSSSLDESQELKDARAELNRLLQLEPQIGQLQLDVDLAKSAVSRLEAEINALDVGGPGYSAARSVVEETLVEERKRLEDAEGALALFKSENGIDDLPSVIDSQQSLVNGLLLAEVSRAGAGSAAGALAIAEANLLELQAAQPEYNRLTSDLARAQDLVDLREKQQQSLAAISPLDDQIEVVKPASLVSGLWWKLIRYTVAVLLGIFLSLTAVYLITLFSEEPLTVEDLQREFAAPVIARIPRAP